MVSNFTYKIFFGGGATQGWYFDQSKLKKDQPGGQNWLKPGFIGQNWLKLELDEIIAKKIDLLVTLTYLKVIYFHVNFHLGSLLTQDFGLNPLTNITSLNIKFFQNGWMSWKAVSRFKTCSYRLFIIKTSSFKSLFKSALFAGV